ncbi:MAG: pectate lyase [Bacteroidales bacterium]|nr:pectate lyase [Bacteroidales bacterium]
MKKIITTILAIALLSGVWAQQTDTMFVHQQQYIYEFPTAEVDSIIFYRTKPTAQLPRDTVRDTVYLVPTAPQIEFILPEMAAIYGTINPVIRFEVNSNVGLEKISFAYLKQGETDPVVLPDEITTFTNEKNYVGEVLGLTQDIFQTLESVEIHAKDIYERTTVQTLNIPRLDAMDDSEIIAFPGAEGFGRYTTGGRGGTVYVVTTLDDVVNNPPAGTFRHAVTRSGARTIVFAVSGTIQLKDRLRINNGDLTIAGQTAPGDGICIAGYDVLVNASNVIIRYMRFRMGDVNDVDQDAIWGRYQNRIILDHCSMSWSVDECASFYENEDFTMQWCILSESMRLSKHEKGAHGYAAIWGGKNASFHHNLLAHHDSRNPRFGAYTHNNANRKEDGLTDFRNNVIYNWGGNSGYGGEGGKYNMVNNYYQPMPASSSKTRIFNIDDDAATGIFGTFYVAGNRMMNDNGTLNTNITNTNWNGITYNSRLSASDRLAARSDTEFEKDVVTTHTAEQAYERVLSRGGASLVRDAVDQRIVNETENRLAPVRAYFTLNDAAWNALPADVRSKGRTRAGMIDSQADVGGWPELSNLPAMKSTANDGIPDVWKIANGLNPETANANGKDLSTVYTNLEIYMNSLVQHITIAQNQ